MRRDRRTAFLKESFTDMYSHGEVQDVYKRQGEVFVRLKDGEDAVRVNVRDTGIGIPKEDQERIFERFYRVDKSHSKEIGGTGLGLSIVKHGVKTLNGRLWLNSEPGQGTEIIMEFPKHHMEEEAAE